MRLTQRGLDLLQLRLQLLLTGVRAGIAAGGDALAAGSMNWRFQFDTDCSETSARRAASATVNSPARIDNTSRVLSSGGTTVGRGISDLLDQINIRPEPDSLTRDIITRDGQLLRDLELDPTRDY